MRNTELKPGYTFSLKAKGIAKWVLTHLIDPPTDILHYGFLWLPLPDGDWVTLESRNFGFFPKGMYPGKLSWNDPADIQFWRPANADDTKLAEAPFETLDLVELPYGFPAIATYFIEVAYLFVRNTTRERKIRKLRLEEFKWAVNKFPICTRVIVVGYDAVGCGVIPPGIPPFPNAFRQAEIAGRWEEIVR